MVGVLSPCHPDSPNHITHPTSPAASAKIIGKERPLKFYIVSRYRNMLNVIFVNVSIMLINKTKHANGFDF